MEKNNFPPAFQELSTENNDDPDISHYPHKPHVCDSFVTLKGYLEGETL